MNYKRLLILLFWLEIFIFTVLNPLTHEVEWKHTYSNGISVKTRTIEPDWFNTGIILFAETAAAVLALIYFKNKK